VPYSAWTGKTNFVSSNVFSKLAAGLEAILTNVQHELSETSSDELKAKIKLEAEVSIYDFINQMAGPITDKFFYEGVQYTPEEFANQYFQELKLPAVEIEITRQEDVVNVINPESLTFPRVKIETTWERAESLMKAIINSGRPIYLSYNHEKQFVDSETGIMSISAFNYPTRAKLVDRQIIGKYYKWSGSHAVLIVGYQVDDLSGRVIKWKIQNSWGQSSGDSGYYHMYADYLKMYAWGFDFVDDGRIDILNKLNL
jgi:bleomycin hydrolase